jgi:hypothetical protein
MAKDLADIKMIKMQGSDSGEYDVQIVEDGKTFSLIVFMPDEGFLEKTPWDLRCVLQRY